MRRRIFDLRSDRWDGGTMAFLATPRSIKHDIEESHVATRRRRPSSTSMHLLPPSSRTLNNVNISPYNRQRALGKALESRSWRSCRTRSTGSPTRPTRSSSRTRRRSPNREPRTEQTNSVQVRMRAHSMKLSHGTGSVVVEPIRLD